MSWSKDHVKSCISIFFWALRLFFCFALIAKFSPILSSAFCSDESMRKQIRECVLNAWNNYSQYAWGHDFLEPLTLSGNDDDGIAFTIIDSLDTLYLMNLTEELKEARQWIVNSFPLKSTVSFFETMIRGVGGLISAYEFTQDRAFLEAARKLADRLIVAFDTPTGLPRSKVNLETGECSDHEWAIGATLLSDVGSCQLELLALTKHTGDPKYADLALRVLETVDKIATLPYSRINYLDLLPNSRLYTFDAFGDSYFEYLIKLHYYCPQNSSNSLQMFRKSIKAAKEMLGYTQYIDNVSFFAEVDPSRTLVNTKLSHLSFFLPGMFYLASIADPEYKEDYLQMAELLIKPNMILNFRKNFIPGESFVFSHSTHISSAFDFEWDEDVYKLRPEHVESLFYAWRITHNLKYKIYARLICASILKRAALPTGYSSIGRPDDTVMYMNKMESFFISETLKYLYLIFSDESDIPLSDYVFTTQAHPLLRCDQ